MQNKQDKWHFPRNDLTKTLLDALESGITNHFTLFAPRRMGKTEFLLQDLIPFAEKRGYCTLYINLWSEQTDPARLIVQKLYDKISKLSLDKELRKITIKGSIPFVGEVATDLEFNREMENLISSTLNFPLLIDKFLEILVTSQKGKPILILLDEVQHLSTLRKFLPLTAALRTALDIRKKSVKVVFTGSSRQGLLRMFNDSKAPFFNMSVNLPFPDLGLEFVEFLLKRYYEICKRKLEPKKALDFFKILHCNPHYFRNLIIKCLFYDLSLEEAYIQISDEISEENNFEGLWSKMNLLDKHIYFTLISGISPYSQEMVEELSIKLKIKLNSTQIQRSINRLVKYNLIAVTARAAYISENELFSDWVKSFHSKIPALMK